MRRHVLGLNRNKMKLCFLLGKTFLFYTLYDCLHMCPREGLLKFGVDVAGALVLQPLVVVRLLSSGKTRLVGTSMMISRSISCL